MGDIIDIRYEDAEITRLFQQIKARAANPQPLLADWGERLKNSVRRNIMEGGRPEKFVPLKAATARSWLLSKKSYWTKAGNLTAAGQKRAEGRTPLLTGNPAGLLYSINWREVPEGLAVGSDKIYAAIHHFGGLAGRGHKTFIPARPYLLIQDDDWAYMRQSALGFLLGEGAWK